jgi:anti-sigma regulatory factor (Ser/Thr protein kinase)
MEHFEATLPPDLARLRGLRHQLSDWLEGGKVPSHARDAIVLAIHEAAANAIDHACSSVSIRGVRDENKLILVVSNSGRWRKPRLSEELSRGRGLTLMEALTSQMEILTNPERTTIRMRVDLQESASRQLEHEGEEQP